LSLLHESPAPSLAPTFVQDTLCQLAAAAKTIVWEPSAAHLIAPTDISETAKHLAAKLRFSQAHLLRLSHPWGAGANTAAPAASSPLWSLISDLSAEAFPDTLTELRATGRFGCEAARQLAAAGKIKNVRTLDGWYTPVPASHVAGLLAAMGGEKTISTLKVTVEGEGQGLSCGSDPEAIPHIRDIYVDCPTVRDEAALDEANAASFVHASLTSCLHIRGLKKLTIQWGWHLFREPAGHFREQMEALCPTGTMGGFRITVRRDKTWQKWTVIASRATAEEDDESEEDDDSDDRAALCLSEWWQAGFGSACRRVRV